MKFKVHLGGQAYNLYLGNSISNLYMLPVTMLQHLDFEMSCYQVTNYWDSPETYIASDYGIDGFSSITFDSNWVNGRTFHRLDTSFGHLSQFDEYVDTNVFDLNWDPYDLSQRILQADGFGTAFLTLKAGGTSTWRLSGVFYPDQLSSCSTCEGHFSNLFGVPAGGVEPSAYDCIVTFTLVDGPTDLIPAPARRNPFINYGTLYFGYCTHTSPSLEYIGYIYMDEDESLNTFSLSDGCLDLDSDSYLTISIPS
jgi:hypothetical protein